MTSKSKELLQKVYDHLDSIDLTKLSMNELKDFLEVVQKGQFLESFGQMPVCSLGGFGGANQKKFAGKEDEAYDNPNWPEGPKGDIRTRNPNGNKRIPICWCNIV